MPDENLTIGRIIHYRTAGGVCYPAMTIKELGKDVWSIQINKGYSTDGVVVRHHHPDEELAWHWPRECPQHR